VLVIFFQGTRGLLKDTPPNATRNFIAHYISHRAKSHTDFVKGVATAFMLNGSDPFYVKKPPCALKKI